MLSHSRPKSQPPLKFVGGTATTAQAKARQSADHWNQLIERYQVVEEEEQQQHEQQVVALQKSSPSDELEASSSSSSSSSLASSSLSLSTTSSTSTVLAALNTMQTINSQQRNRSLIARYSAPSNNISTTTTTSTGKPHVATEETAGEEDEANSTSSSSSTSSGSSGLSSMNSSSQHSSIESRHQQQQPVAADEEVEDDNDHDGDDDDYDNDELQVGRCLSELVDSVVTEEERNNEIEYKTFKIHEALPAKTRSIATSSSDEDNAESTCLSPPLVDSVGQNVKQMLGDAVSEVYSIRLIEFSANADSSAVINLARKNVASALRQQTKQTNFLVALHSDRALVEWRQTSIDRPDEQTLDDSLCLSMAQISHCILDGQLVVWFIAESSEPTSPKRRSGSEVMSSTSELETTLDDIALALDEPVTLHSNGSIQQRLVADSSSTGNRTALVWLCFSESDAKRFQNTFEEIKGKMQSQQQHQQQMVEQQQSARRPLSAPKQPVDSIEINDHDGSQYKLSSAANDSSSGVKNNRSVQQVKIIEKSNSDSLKATNSNSKSTEKAKSLSIMIKDHHHHQHQHQQRQQEQQQQQQQPKERKKNEDEGAREVNQETSVETSVAEELEKSTISSDEKRSSKQREGKLNKCLIADSSDDLKVKPLNAELKRSKKSASGLDLSRTASASTSSSGSNLASYYRSVANKVFSNGQSKIKSFKDEMIKFNNRMPSSASAKRISLAVQSSDRSALFQVSGSVNNLSSLLTEGDQCDSIDHQQRSSGNRSLNQVEKEKKTSLSNNTTIAVANNTTIAQAKVDQTPAIKPRTSILKNKNSDKNGAQCDINNNYIRNDDQQVAHQQQQQQTTFANKRASDEKEQQLRSQKPKSILKSAKPTTCAATAAAAASYVVEERSQVNAKYLVNGSHKSALSVGGRKEVKQLVAAADSIQQPKSCLKSDLLHSAPRQRAALSASSSETLERRKSAYPRSNEIAQVVTSRRSDKLQVTEELEEDEELSRDKAFERLRQRASCYDISRLMSKHGLQNQLKELRTGSSNSIAGKSRQRRPALLLADNKCDYPPTKTTPSQKINNNGHELDDYEVDGGNERDATQDYMRSVGVVKSTTSGADGTVRAKVSVTQLKPSVEEIEWTGRQQGGYSASGASAQGGRRQQQVLASLAKEKEELANVQRIKKSEFDPRTLKKPSFPIEPVKEAEFVAKEEIASGSDEELSAEDEEPASQVTSSSLSKSGPFSLLRQSFNQKTLSSMLKFSGRASLRIKAAPAGSSNNSESKESEKSKAIAIAEANLLAAKQLKQQAQKLKEQQKREQQQQATLDPTAMMLAAVHYNQQVQRQQQQQQQQHQQQQLLYQQAQQYAVAARGQMYDASGVHMQHQMLIQRQQQQQMAYMASHYMAQQMAVMQSASPMLPIGAIPPPTQQLMYAPPSLPVQGQHQSAGVFKKSILKGSKQASTPAIMYPSQAPPGQHMIPMSVNHHSSFNIVYTGSSSSQIPQLQHQQQNDEIVTTQAQPQLAKHSSLGASMRKTVKSILINRSSFLSTSSHSAESSSKTSVASEPKLKSVLKSSGSRDLVLNSEGSDGDGSSSDSTTTCSNTGAPLSSSRSQVNGGHLPKSALKKTSIQRDSSSASSDSSCSSASGGPSHRTSMVLCDDDKGTLTRASEYRQSVKINGDHYFNPSSVKAPKRGGPPSTSARKNVTFSTKLTSIL